MKSQTLLFDGIFITGTDTTEQRQMRTDKYKIVQHIPQSLEDSILGYFPFRWSSSLVLLQGSLYQIGGGVSNIGSTFVNAFDLIQTRNQRMANMHVPGRARAVACSKRDILVCGGNNWLPLTSCELFQANSNKWIEMPALNTARCDLQLVWMPDGRIFAIGGDNMGSTGPLNDVEMLVRCWSYDGLTEGSWQRVSKMRTARCGFGSVLLHDIILVAGGCVNTRASTNRVELFSPPAIDDPLGKGQWTEIQPMKSAMVLSSGVVFNEDVYMFGWNTRVQRFRSQKTKRTYAGILTLFLKGCVNFSTKFDDWSWDELECLTSVKEDIRAVAIT